MTRALLVATAAALLLATPAAAHVTVTPAFVAAYDTHQFVFSASNERQAPMTGFSLSVPKRFRIVDPGHQPTWDPIVFGSKVTWRAGSLPAGQRAAFVVDLKGPATPGAVILDAEHLYPSGAVVRWPVQFTVVPGTQASQNLGWAALPGLQASSTALFIALAWRRREHPLRER